MSDISVLSQILNGGTPLILLVGLVYLFRTWREDKRSSEQHSEQIAEEARIRERALCSDHEEALIQINEQYRAFVVELTNQQKAMITRVAEALDRNTDAFQQLGSEQKAAERQIEIIKLLKKEKPL